MKQSRESAASVAERISQECRILDEGCALRRFLDLFCNRGTSLAVNALSKGTQRFGELQHLIPDISKKMLS